MNHFSKKITAKCKPLLEVPKRVIPKGENPIKIVKKNKFTKYTNYQHRYAERNCYDINVY